MSSAAFVPTAIVNLVAGSLNTLVAKWMDQQSTPVVSGGPDVEFNHPFVQGWLMMMGECLCLIVYVIRHGRGGRDPTADDEDAGDEGCTKYALLFWLPMLLDWTGTTVIFMAYFYLAASSIQMLRGSSVLFTCLLAKFYMGRKQYPHHILGVTLVILGLTVVSFASIIHPEKKESSDDSSKSPVVGICMVLFSQMLAAVQFTLEEKLNTRHPIHPLLAIGTEGTGGITLGCLIVGVASYAGKDNIGDYFAQAGANANIVIGSCMMPLSIAFFNGTGFALTKLAGATARSTIDASRTLLVWIGDLSMGWSHFFWMQPVGLALLICGTMLYNNIIQIKALMGQEEIDALEGNLDPEGTPYAGVPRSTSQMEALTEGMKTSRSFTQSNSFLQRGPNSGRELSASGDRQRSNT